MGTLLTLLGLFLLYKLFRGFFFIYRAKKNADEFWRQFAAQAGGASQQSAGQQRRPQPQPEQKPKKIGRDVGEYVRFQEIDETRTETATDASGNTARTVTEQQVVDVEWEDIK